MSKITKLRELLKAKLKKDITRGSINEGWFENWMDSIFNRAASNRIKNDPNINKLKVKLAKDVEDFKKLMLKNYGSYDKIPAVYKKIIEKGK